jgi:hypothetical protein
MSVQSFSFHTLIGISAADGLGLMEPAKSSVGTGTTGENTGDHHTE